MSENPLSEHVSNGVFGRAVLIVAVTCSGDLEVGLFLGELPDRPLPFSG